MASNFHFHQAFEERLKGRYITTEMIQPLLDSYSSKFEISIIGNSENGLPIHLVRIGHGAQVVFGWSQMHGNESTTTKALFDFMKFVDSKVTYGDEIEIFFNTYSFYFVPILNPDGARLYTRNNGKDVDLNRDAVNLSQIESRILRKTFDLLKPSLCLNLHGQRTIYGVNNKSATISFLAPAADEERALTSSRITAMEHIVQMNESLQQLIPGQVGRYDDTYNENCVGDTFQKNGVPTILFEAGHYKNDYDREIPRSLIFNCFLSLFKITGAKIALSHEHYFQIPENNNNFRDVIVRNISLNGEKNISLAIQYEEKLVNETIELVPKVDSIGKIINFKGHREIVLNGEEILVNSHENVCVDEIILTIVTKNDNLTIFPAEFLN